MRRTTGRRFGVLLSIAAVLSLAIGSYAVPMVVAANPSASLDQCANDPAPSPSTNGCDTNASQWVNGNLGASKSVYFEGDSIPYRLTFQNLATSGSHNVTIEWDTTKSSKHALDYIDTVNQSVTTANPCLGVNGCSGFSTFTIPNDPQVTGAGVTPLAGVFRMYGGTISAVSAYSYSTGTGFVGDKSARITVTFSTTVANPVLAWGGHIATRKDWGNNNAAVAIPGSPYHTRLISLDGAGGNQDRSLSADAVVFPGFIHIVKNTVGGNGQFAFTASPSPLTNFNITTTGGPPGTGEQDFDSITNFQTYSVAETVPPPPANFAFTSLSCAVASPNGGTQSTSGATATIALKEGEEVTCTYTNTFSKNSPSISTTLSATSATVGDSVHDSATITGATSTAGGTATYTVYTDNACTQGARDAGTVNVTNGSVPDSNSLAFNSAGTFYWQVVYSGDANNSGATSTCTDEKLVVGQASPGISTTLSLSSIVVGNSIHDSATLSGATGDAGGTVTYTVYSDSSCSQNARDAGTVNVTNGSVPDSNTLAFNSAGTFYWQAVYSGDANNKSATSTCTDETLTVAKASPTISTTLSATTGSIGDTVHDSATLSGASSDAGGTVTYTVYTDSACSLGARDAGTKTVSAGVVTDSNGLVFNTAGTFYWQAVYSGDANNNGATSTCTDETLVIGKNSPSNSTAQHLIPNDSMTLSGATSNAGGTITFNLYSPSDATCSGAPALTQTVNVSGNGTYSTTNSSFIASDTGTWRWVDVYSGDANNNGTTSTCGTESFTITNG